MMTLTTHSGKWPSPRCMGRKHSGFSESKPFTRLAQMSEQGGSAAHLLLRGSDQEDRPIRGGCLTHQAGRLPHRVRGPPPSAGGNPTRQEEPLVHRVGGPPLPHLEDPSMGQQKLLPRKMGRPSLPHLGQQDLTGLVAAGAAAFLQTST